MGETESLVVLMTILFWFIFILGAICGVWLWSKVSKL